MGGRVRGAGLQSYGTSISPADGSGTPAQTEITVNDGEMGTGLFQFEFSAGWVHEGGYPARFVGGDEHWSTTATSGAALPSLTFRFSGTKVSLYGHKVPAGGMACVTIDGADAGVVDFYNAVRNTGQRRPYPETADA